LKSSIKHEIITFIKTKHEIPHKFAYLKNGARIWDMVSRDPAYDLGRRELSVLRKFLQLFLERQTKEPFNILHIGPGNGLEIQTVLDTFGIKRIPNYGLVDISSELLGMSKSLVEKHSEGIKFLYFIHDVTNKEISDIAASLRQNEASSNIILLVANGAILSNSPVLTYIHKSMKPKDILLITLEVYSAKREKQILEQYKLPAILDLFGKSLSLIGIRDFSIDQFEFNYNKVKSNIEVYFDSKKWLKFHYSDNIIFDFPLPDKIKIFSSYRPTPYKLKNFLSSKGFKTEIFHYFKKEKCCGVACSVQ